jgi:hypothetical protein
VHVAPVTLLILCKRQHNAVRKRSHVVTRTEVAAINCLGITAGYHHNGIQTPTWLLVRHISTPALFPAAPTLPALHQC